MQNPEGRELQHSINGLLQGLFVYIGQLRMDVEDAGIAEETLGRKLDMAEEQVEVLAKAMQNIVSDVQAIKAAAEDSEL